MGILRTDRVAGLGGANAIKGSVFFGNNLDSTGGATGFDYLITERSSNFTFGTGDITIEGWFFCPKLSSSTDYQSLVGDTIYYNGDDSLNGFTFYIEDGQLNFWNDESNSVVSGGTIVQNEWNHLAYTRESGSNKIFVNGSLVGTASDSTNYTDTALTIGVNKVGQTSGTDAGQFPFHGFASNVRVLKGRALYTAAFTPPVGELQVIDNTVLLCCQSPGNVLQEATGVILTAPRINSGNTGDVLSGAKASHFTPNSPVGFSTTTDVGTQFGSTFDGVTTFDSQAYMVPPGGNTRERNRGRGVISGGRNRSTMEFINIQSQGNSQTFGDSVTGDGIEGFAVGSSTRGLFSGPQSPLSNVIEFITFASQSNGTDFGDTTSARRSGAGAGNETRGLFAGGIVEASSPYGGTNITDFVTIATAGNATDFGDLNTANEQAAPNADTTRVVIAGGTINGGNSVNNIDFFTIATTGNATDFGDMTTAHGAGAGGASSSTRGLIAGGVSPDKLNTIQFITIQTTGNSSEYGDLTSARGYPSGMSNSIRGVFAGGYEPTQVNTIDFVNIATTSNAIDFGDLSLGVNFVTQATSDCHGGLS